MLKIVKFTDVCMTRGMPSVIQTSLKGGVKTSLKTSLKRRCNAFYNENLKTN